MDTGKKYGGRCRYGVGRGGVKYFPRRFIGGGRFHINTREKGLRENGNVSIKRDSGRNLGGILSGVGTEVAVEVRSHCM